MEGMKINISVQRKTNIESNRTPNQKTKISKIKSLLAVGPLERAVGPAVTAVAVGPVDAAVGPVKNRSEKLF